jgi:inosine-uridine nucleoside N-ribohydrolase
MSDTAKIIIDTDPGHDDALAILLLEKSGIFDIQAITTVAGNANIQDATNNARYILDLVSSSTPLYSGADKPLKRELITANVHGKGGLAGAKVIKQEELSNNAAQKIIEIVQANPHQISILVLGPQTNIAQAFIEEPTLPSLIKEIVIMGGAITVPGNKNRVAEFNVFVDPEAASIVLDADVKKLLVPLDACNDIGLSLQDFEQLQGTPLYEPIKDMMEPYITGIRAFEKTGKALALMYDVLAAYCLINPTAYQALEMDVRVETNGELTRGMTIADRRTWGEKRHNVSVVTSIDRDAFVNYFFQTLKN